MYNRLILCTSPKQSMWHYQDSSQLHTLLCIYSLHAYVHYINTTQYTVMNAYVHIFVNSYRLGNHLVEFLQE